MAFRVRKEGRTVSPKLMRLSMLSPTPPLSGKVWGRVGIRQNQKSNAPPLGQY